MENKTVGRFLKSILALALLCIISTTARAVWDSTLGNMPDTYRLCWGLASNACIYGSTVSNYVRIQTGGVDAITVNSSQAVGIPGALSVTGNTTIAGTLAVTGAITATTSMSSFTVANATGSITQTGVNLCIAQSTVSLTLPSQISTIWVSYSGASSSTVAGSTITVGVLIDGGYATIAGIAQSSTKGILSVGNGRAGASGVGGNDVSLSFGPLPISGLSAGSHTLCLVEASTSGTLFPDSAGEISAFTAYYLP